MYIEAARLVLGGIDLDPASCAEANRIVQAEKYYTKSDNGLTQPWYKRVWLNPPFGTTGINDHKGSRHSGQSKLRLFTEKLVRCWKDQCIESAILLARADPTAAWFYPLWEYPVCFVSGDFYFYAPGGRAVKHRFGTCFVYLGPDEPLFIDVFSQFGTVVERVSSPPTQTTPKITLWDYAHGQ